MIGIDQKIGKPFTVDHKLGIVSRNSYTAILKPREQENEPESGEESGKTHHKLSCYCACKRKGQNPYRNGMIQMACGCIRRVRSRRFLKTVLDTPIPPVGENKFLLVKRPRLKPTHVSVSGETVGGSVSQRK